VRSSRPDGLGFRRELRRATTPAETTVWRALRNRSLADVKFRRQHPVGPYVLDFYCPVLRLAIEVDGDSHYLPGGPEHDAERERFLEVRGIRVLRFTNSEVHEREEDVMRAIWTEIEARSRVHPSPRPSPLGEAEGRGR
jgi:very-short-patch-repair endonuclease